MELSIISVAGSWKAPGAAAALLLLAVLASVGCRGTSVDDVRRSAYFPASLTVIGSMTHDDEAGWRKQTVGVGFTWPLKPPGAPSAPLPSPAPAAARNVVLTP